MPPGAAGEPDQCIALTTAGTRCSRPAGDDGFCYQHDETAETIDLEEPAAAGSAESSRPPRRRRRRETAADEGAAASEATADTAVAEEPSPEPASDEPESSLPPIDTDVPPRADAGPSSSDAADGRAAAGEDDDLAERLKRGTERHYRESRRLLEHQTEAVEASSRQHWAAAKQWYATSVLPAARSARDDLRERWSRLTERRSTDRK